MGGLTWFAIPFTLATTMGLAYLGLSSSQAGTPHKDSLDTKLQVATFSVLGIFGRKLLLFSDCYFLPFWKKGHLWCHHLLKCKQMKNDQRKHFSTKLQLPSHFLSFLFSRYVATKIDCNWYVWTNFSYLEMNPNWISFNQLSCIPSSFTKDSTLLQTIIHERFNYPAYHHLWKVQLKCIPSSWKIQLSCIPSSIVKNATLLHTIIHERFSSHGYHHSWKIQLSCIPSSFMKDSALLQTIIYERFSALLHNDVVHERFNSPAFHHLWKFQL